MTDQRIASIGRQLATALSDAAYTRSLDDKKRVLLLQTELCQEVLREEQEKPE